MKTLQIIILTITFIIATTLTSLGQITEKGITHTESIEQTVVNQIQGERYKAEIEHTGNGLRYFIGVNYSGHYTKREVRSLFTRISEQYSRVQYKADWISKGSREAMMLEIELPEEQYNLNVIVTHETEGNIIALTSWSPQI